MLQQQLPARGFLVSVGLDPDEILVEFQYNPTQLSDKRSVNYATIDAPGLLMPTRQYSQGGDRTISFTVRIDGLFDGSVKLSDGSIMRYGNTDNNVYIDRDNDGSILPELNKYRAFLYPQTDRWQDARASFLPLYSNERNAQERFVSPPLCRFGFGFGSDQQTGSTRGSAEVTRIIDCIVTEVGITELLFNDKLLPLRADVAVTLVELSPYGNTPTPPPRG
ncbi:hypothetical protein ACKFKG_30125 [Phormidesmis sp. 146-35]